MSISTISSGSNVNVSAVARATARAQSTDSSSPDRSSGTQDSFQNDFGSLLKAIKSGDLATAQSALASLKTDVGSSGTYSPSSTSSPSSASSGIDADLKSMFDAVSNGDIGGAQSALSSFTTDVKAAAPQGGPHRAHGHHGPHGPKGPPPADADGTDDSSTTDATADTTASNATASNATAATQLSEHHQRNHGLEAVIASLFSDAATDSTGSDTTTTNS